MIQQFYDNGFTDQPYLVLVTFCRDTIIPYFHTIQYNDWTLILQWVPCTSG